MCALQSIQSSIEIKIARCFAFVGPHLPLDTHFAIGNFIGDVLAGRPIRINGDGTPMRSYLYASDLAIWLWTTLFQAPHLTAINVGSDHDLSILELARAVVQSLNASIDIQVAKEVIPGAGIARYVPSVDRARRLLGLNETVDLQEAIRRTAAWYVEEGKGGI
jgi:dTDP-glucose 4,6-dehydratase